MNRQLWQQQKLERQAQANLRNHQAHRQAKGRKQAALEAQQAQQVRCSRRALPRRAALPALPARLTAILRRPLPKMRGWRRPGLSSR